ncbi:MAG: glycoside hydrolase family 95-like protein [Cyclobacteriaceae bacterium]
MIRILISVLLLLSTVQSFGQQRNSTILEVDYEKIVSGAALTYDKPVSRSEEGMPVGNGTMGSLVWTTPSALRFQLNRVDVFGNNSASNNFYERHTDYCGGLGFVDLDFLTEGTFAEKNFRQHLSPYIGLATVEGHHIKARVLAWNEQDIMAVEVEDDRPPSELVHVKLRTLRSPVTKRGNHTAISRLKVMGNKIVLTQEFREDLYYCASSVVVEIVGREARATLENETTIRLVVAPGDAKFSVLMASAATFDPEEDVVALSFKKLEEAKSKGFEGLLQSNKVWWENFWEKSFIHLSSDDGKASLIERNYYYYLYVMASSSRGPYPPKFNGMLWTTGGDDRKWGNLYWGANQSCLYNALFQTNRMELLEPMFHMYSAMRKSCEIAAAQQWGSKGIYIPETVAFDGLAPLPEGLAAEMRELYLLRKPWAGRSQEFSDYAFTKMPFLSRWNWKKDDGWKDGRWNASDKGGGAFGHVTHIFSRGAKIAYQYWLRYEYTQDRDWLREEGYPMLKGVAEFYRNFPNLKKEGDGKYHIYHVNDNESVWGGHNTVEELSSMMGVLPVAIKASEMLNVDADFRLKWSELLKDLSPLPTSDDYRDGSPKKGVTWARALPPVIQGNGNRLPDPNTLPVWFFDLCTLESDLSVLETANATFDAYFEKGIEENTSIHVLSKLPVAGSLLGRPESTEFLIANQIETSEIRAMPNRMDLREGFQTTSAQRLGRAAEALHYALCQSVPSQPGREPVIRVFPAWPGGWDAQFSLLCRGGFLVNSSLQKGKIEFVEIFSQSGSDCRIRNPWPGKPFTIYRNEKKWKDSKDELLVFETRKNDHFIMVSKGDTPEMFKKRIGN